MGNANISITNAPIHLLNSRGQTASKLASYDIGVLGTDTVGSVPIGSTATIELGGFGNSSFTRIVGATSTSGLTNNVKGIYQGLTGAHRIQDSYTPDYLRGHYLHVAGITGYFHNSNFKSSTHKNNVTIFQKNYDESGTTIASTQIYSHNFYRDEGWDDSNVASVSQVNISGVTGAIGYTPVTGIYLASSNDRLGQFFYRNGILLSYSAIPTGALVLNGGVTAMPGNYLDVDNAGGYTAIKKFDLEFSNSIKYTRTTSYGNECKVLATPHNWMGLAGFTAVSNTLYAVFDPNTLNLINNSAKYPSSPQAPYIGSYSAGGHTAYNAVTNLLTPGYRIWSDPYGPTYLPKANGFTAVPYNHTWDISSNGNIPNGFFNGDATRELAMYNGLYISKAASQHPYKNYKSPLYYPLKNYTDSLQPNYSSIAENSKRYASFIWRYTHTDIYGQQLLYAKFIMYDCTRPIVYRSDNVKLFYRIEFPSNMSVSDLLRFMDDLNTTWINTSGEPEADQSNYSNTSIVAGGNNAAQSFSSTGSGTNYTTTFYTQQYVRSIVSGQTILLYATVEVPMDADFGFSHIKAGLFY
jgi:hypothetical protein